MVDLVPQECDMTRDELLEHHMKLCAEARELMKAKNKDYAGNEGIEPFANFTRVESMGICKTEQGFMVRLTDKMSRLSSFIRAGKMHVADESFKDTCIDVINYMVLLSAYIADKDAEKKQQDTKEPTIYIEPRLLKESPYSNNGCCKNTK
jgi:hypothetical protein